MSILQDFFEKFKDDLFWFIFLDIIFLISPGFLVIFIFFRDIFLTLDTLKLILLVISITAPISFMITAILESPKDTIKRDLFREFSLGICITGVILSFPVFLSWVLRYSFNQFIFLTIAFGILIISFSKKLINKEGKEGKNK